MVRVWSETGPEDRLVLTLRLSWVTSPLSSVDSDLELPARGAAPVPAGGPDGAVTEGVPAGAGVEAEWPVVGVVAAAVVGDPVAAVVLVPWAALAAPAPGAGASVVEVVASWLVASLAPPPPQAARRPTAAPATTARPRNVPRLLICP